MRHVVVPVGFHQSDSDSFWNLFLTAILCLAFLGCTGQKSQSSASPTSNPNLNDDFAHTVISADIGVADGQTPLQVSVHLVNSNGTVVANYTPQYAISGGGVEPGPCTASDQNGYSNCTVLTTILGNKTFELTNAKMGLTTLLQFVATLDRKNTMVLAGALAAPTQDGYQIKMTLGAPLQRYNAATSDGYKINFYVNGIQ
jgi:hypothetical protein